MGMLKSPARAGQVLKNDTFSINSRIEQLNNNIDEIYNDKPFLSLTKSTTQAGVGNGALNALTWDVQLNNTLFSFTDGNSKIFVPITGKYLVTANVAWEQNGTGRRTAFIAKNGINSGSRNLYGYTANQTISGESFSLTSSAILSCIQGDYIEVYARYSNAASLLFLGGSEDECKVQISLLF